MSSRGTICVVRPLRNISGDYVRGFANSGLLPENGAVGCGATGAVHHMKGKIHKNWTKHGPCAGGGEYKDAGGWMGILHTYLEGVIPFMYWGYGL